LLIPYGSILRSMCPTEKALEVRASVERSESFALGKRFVVAKLTASRSLRAKLRPRLLVISGRLFRHPRSKSAPAKISWFLTAGPAWKQANCRLSHPFLIIRKIGYPFPLSVRRRKASLTVDRLQQGEPSLFGSSSAQCQCGTLPILVPNGVTLFTARPHGSKKKRRSCAILWWSLSWRWEKPQEGGVEWVQSLCAADNVKNRRRNNTINYTGSFHKPEVVLSSLHFQGEFH